MSGIFEPRAPTSLRVGRLVILDGHLDAYGPWVLDSISGNVGSISRTYPSGQSDSSCVATDRLSPLVTRAKE